MLLEICLSEVYNFVVVIFEEIGNVMRDIKFSLPGTNIHLIYTLTRGWHSFASLLHNNKGSMRYHSSFHLFCWYPEQEPCVCLFRNIEGAFGHLCGSRYDKT